MKRTILIFGIILIGFTSMAQNKSAKMTFEVKGVCMMCKKRIEKTAIKITGVKYAKWNKDTKQLTLIINEHKTSKKVVQQALAKVGHDNGEFKATNDVYANLPACCKYRDKEALKKTKCESEKK